MDQQGILEILKFANRSNLTEIEVEQKDFKLRIRKGSEENIIYSSVPLPQQVQPIQQVAAPPPAPAPPATEPPASKAAPSAPAEEDKKSDNLITFPSPMIGTFYRSSSPDKEPYMKVGDVVSKGQVLCIVEAMKLFNEIEYDGEKDGKIVKILVENSQPVEYDQPLFLIELG